MRFPPPLRIAAFFLALGSASCLITDPVIPLDTATNQAPEWQPGRPQPAPQSPLNYTAGSTQQLSFDASARDPDGDLHRLFYKWTLDGTTVASGEDATFFTTTPAAIGTGTHQLRVEITDTGTPQGVLEANWTLVVQ